MFTQKFLYYKYLAWLITIIYSSKLGLELWHLSRLLSVYKIASTLNRLYSETIEPLLRTSLILVRIRQSWDRAKFTFCTTNDEHQHLVPSVRFKQMSLRGRTNFRSSIYKIFSSATSIQSHGRHPNSILVAIYSLESSSPRKQQVTRWHFTTTQPAKPAIYIHSLPFNISVCLLWYRNWKHSSNRSRTHLYISHHSLGHVAP